MAAWGARLTIVHLTDGSPRNGADAKRVGFESREAYADARRDELREALALARIRPEQCRQFGFTDQEAGFHIPEIIEKLRAQVQETGARRILAHPYEGGHPDHDTAALAAAIVSQDMQVPLWEFTSYHAGCFGDFLPNSASDSVERNVLTPEQRVMKRKQFDCFRSQQHVLKYFPIQEEKFRPAPRYDFTRPPHAGRLHYEQLGWDWTGERWRSLAAEVLYETHRT